MSDEKIKTTVKGYGGFPMHSWRDVGRLGYGSGGRADSPWGRQGIFVLGDNPNERGVDYGGPGLPLERRHRLENPGLKRVHDFVNVNGLCLTCNMMKQGHDKLMEKLNEDS